jgi:hypothetical protein
MPYFEGKAGKPYISMGVEPSPAALALLTGSFLGTQLFGCAAHAITLW